MDLSTLPLVLVWVLVLGPVWFGCLSGAPWFGSCPDMCRCEREEGRGTVLKVDCEGRGLRRIPENLSWETSVLDLSMNEVSDLPERGFTDLSSLRELRLAGNPLRRIDSDAFLGLHRLSELTLHNTDLRSVPSAALDKLSNLRSLRLDANRLSELPPSCFRGLSELRFLWLDDNELRETPGGALELLPQLRALTLGLNRLRHLPDRAFHRLAQLRLLHLQHNQIQSLSHMCFSGLHNLHTLDLSFNRIHFFSSAFQLLTTLQELNLQNNQISFVPEHAVRGKLLQLKEIDLQNNPLFVIGTVRKLSKFPTQLTKEQNKPSGSHQTHYNRLETCQSVDPSLGFSLLLFIIVFFLRALAKVLFKTEALECFTPVYT